MRSKRFSFVFARLTSYLDRNKFNYLVRKCQGDSYIKHFLCWNQLKVLMFGQLSRRESLRDLIVAVETHSGKAKFLGFGDSVTRSNLAKANHNRRTLPCSLLLGEVPQEERRDKNPYSIRCRGSSAGVFPFESGSYYIDVGLQYAPSSGNLTHGYHVS